MTQPFVPGYGPAIPAPAAPAAPVYSPGNPSPASNEYTTWAAAYAAAGASPKTIYVDDQYVSPAVIPAGTWNVEALIGLSETATAVAVSTDSGCLINRLSWLERVNLYGTAPIPTVRLVSGQLLRCFFSSLSSQGGVPLVQQVSGFSAVVLENSQIGLGLAVDVLGGLSVQSVYGSTVTALSIDSSNAAGICVVQRMTAGGFSESPQGPGVLYIQANYGGGQNVFYQPSNLVNWSGITPTSISDALDRIAAALGPIP